MDAVFRPSPAPEPFVNSRFGSIERLLCPPHRSGDLIGVPVLFESKGDVRLQFFVVLDLLPVKTTIFPIDQRFRVRLAGVIGSLGAVFPYFIADRVWTSTERLCDLTLRKIAPQ